MLKNINQTKKERHEDYVIEKENYEIKKKSLLKMLDEDMQNRSDYESEDYTESDTETESETDYEDDEDDKDYKDDKTDDEL